MAKATAEEIAAWARAEAAKILQRPPERIDLDAKLSRLGLDSATAVHLMVMLEDWLGVELDPELAFEHPTLRRLAEAIAERLG
jgi:acyl carrier protein